MEFYSLREQTFPPVDRYFFVLKINLYIRSSTELGANHGVEERVMFSHMYVSNVGFDIVYIFLMLNQCFIFYVNGCMTVNIVDDGFHKQFHDWNLCMAYAEFHTSANLLHYTKTIYAYQIDNVL